jgi:hypothetical protein
MSVRLETGAIVDDVAVEDLVVTVRFERCAAGWRAAFELAHPSTDLVVIHRLVAPTLAAARAAVPPAVEFLCGAPVDEPLLAE